jgi:hypothetical protein
MVALWGRKLEGPSRLFLKRYETRSLYGASSRGIPVKNKKALNRWPGAPVIVNLVDHVLGLNIIVVPNLP